MVVALGPGRFYGSGLPRPRYYTDVKLNDERVDPPASVLDPLLSWAKEAHWSMGGLSFQRYRLQGRIEGSIKRLKAQYNLSDKKKRAAVKARISGVKPESLKSLDSPPGAVSEEIVEEAVTAVPPLQPKKKRARKLMDEFEKVAAEEGVQTKTSVASVVIKNPTPKKAKKKERVDPIPYQTRSRKSTPINEEKVVRKAATAAVRRVSPRWSVA